MTILEELITLFKWIFSIGLPGWLSKTIYSSYFHRRILQLRVHRAFVQPEGPECFFINMVNLSKDRDIEVTHVQLRGIPVTHEDRPFPKRLQPDESYETWIKVDDVSDPDNDAIFKSATARISTGDIIKSTRNKNVPSFGNVPGGRITQI